MKIRFSILLCWCLLMMCLPVKSQQSNELWHGKSREIHYKPDGEDFVLVHGSRRFNRALYGGNTAFRAEAGDLPEFALYMPGMGGNLNFGLIAGDSSKWLIDAKNITTRYRPGTMIYDISDPYLGKGNFRITVLALYKAEGIIVKTESKDVPSNVKLLVAFGGATGTKFSRDGDIGADPESSFYLKQEYCKDNIYQLHENSFSLSYGFSKTLTEEERYEVQHLAQQNKDTGAKRNSYKTLIGVFPPGMQIKLADASKQQSPAGYFASTVSSAPAIVSTIDFKNDQPLYFFIQNSATPVAYSSLEKIFNEAENTRKELAGRIKVNTPDPFINTLGGTLAVAADAVWEDPSYMHGAVAWRMRLNGWRGAYMADVLGWRDRAVKHFSSYALSQLTTPQTGPVVSDTALHLARQLEKLGTSLFSSGYISRNPNGDFRPHHYDMNMVFIDQLLTHFLWTGDTAYAKKMWPLLQRHLAWEKRNFDADGDGLYDAYAAIWASDALQYSGGGVTHSSAYNYRANKIAADLAKIIGKDASPYQKEAEKILSAINDQLWMPGAGSYAEYKDLLSSKQLHPAAGVWTIYHSLDSKINDPFQGYQSLRYIDNEIPRIPIRAKGLSDTTLYTISTTNWQPYTWSLNNVALAEVMHTALAYWQGGRSESAYKLWKSALIESMYLGASPGNIQQLSFYDAIRGELYRDFADPIAMTARTLVEGLFGIVPDALHDTLAVTPGLPAEWDHASLTTPDFDFSFRRSQNTDRYVLQNMTGKLLNLHFTVKAKSDTVEKILVNGKNTNWMNLNDAVDLPMLSITASSAKTYFIEIIWKGSPIEKPVIKDAIAEGENLNLHFSNASIQKVYDPQNVLSNIQTSENNINSIVKNKEGNKTFFIQLKQGPFSWWSPVNIRVIKPVEIIVKENGNSKSELYVKNNTAKVLSGRLVTGNFQSAVITLQPNQFTSVQLDPKNFIAGTNEMKFLSNNINTTNDFITWDISNLSSVNYEKIDLSIYYNDFVTSIFKKEYLSPRPAVPTLQLPTQGIGNWAYPLTTAEINDSGLRKRAGNKKEIVIQQGIPFNTPSDINSKNIIYTSLWDNYPDSVTLPLNGTSSHAYFLMAGSTNPMQSRLTNGEVIVHYTDSSSAKLELKNPQNWWPIEQDYYVDGYAFTTDAPKPVRVYLKSGEDTRTFAKFTGIKGFSSFGVEGGAATVLDLPLDKKKTLKNIVIKTVASDVVVGLMSLTLVR